MSRVLFKQIKILIFTVAITLINFPVLASVCDRKEPTFKPPHRSEKTGNRSDAVTRTFCPQTKQVFRILVPPNSFGLTVSEFTIFWLYIPYDSGRLELRIQERNTKNIVHEAYYKLENSLGLIGIEPGEKPFILEVGREYIWSFDLFCNPENSSDSLSVNGIIIRQPINDELKRRIDSAPPLEKLNIYANYGIWFDLLTELIKLRIQDPTDSCLERIWDKILRENLIDPNNI